MSRRVWISFLLFSMFAHGALATIFGTVRGTVRDDQQHAIGKATVELRAETSAWRQSSMSDPNGAFSFTAVPLGRYRLLVTANGFVARERAFAVDSGTVTTLDMTLGLLKISENVSVVAAAGAVDTKSPTTQVTISRIDVARTPGADQANSLAIITDFVPGSYVVHDQLHVRGGHQVGWLVDGVPVPNTNISSNVGPQFDPRDIDYMEMQRGGYSAEVGDRTYAVFNVVPRSGFERKNDGTLTLSFGTHRTTNDQVSAGSHTDHFAYYASVNANRTDAGLETPVTRLIHDQQSGAGAFASLIYLPSSTDQLRVVGSGRTDSYQIPNDEDMESQGVRDSQRERDFFLNATWLRTVSPKLLLTVAPFFHANRANFDGGEHDPISTTDHRTSHYAGLQSTIAGTWHRQEASAGVLAYRQNDEHQFGVVANDGSGLSLSQRLSPAGSLEAAFVEDSIPLTSRITLRAGLRQTWFRGDVHESATTPRLGLAARLPAGIVARMSWGRYYQPPPLATVSGPILDLVLQQGFGFLPLHGERDRQLEAGISVPARGWTFDGSAFRTEARNFFDHDVLGNSNIFFPLTIDRAHIRGFELMISSPVGSTRRFHLAYSHQTVEGEGAVAGGLTDFTPPEGRFLLDHDQRNTLSTGGTAELPAAMWLSGNLNYGSGFLDGNGPAHLPGHTTFDAALGKSFARYSLRLTATNVTNRRYLLDVSNTFGGTHYVEPRKVVAQVDWKFHY
ncbi:MAG TPA: TonB-dependent receptor [Thermoanaerobaculia bacterium]